MLTKFIIIIAAIIAVFGVLLLLRVIRRTAFLTIAGVLVVICALGSAKLLQFSAMGAQKFMMPPDTVTTAAVGEQSWAPLMGAVGSLAAVQGVTLAAEMDGKVAAISFESGARVKAGDLLVQLDVASEQAQLRSAEAATALAQVSLARAKELLASHTVAQSEYDAADAQAKQAEAAAENIRSVIEKKTIRAPFSGRTGIRMVNLGQTIKSGQAIVSLQSLDPIYVDFQLPQQRLADLKAGLPVEVRTDAIPGRALTGRITAINPDVDQATRNVQVQATLANSDELLRPGMFADVSVQLPDRQKVLVIPATSVLYAPFGNSVFIVEDKKDEATGQTTKAIRQQFVRLGDSRGDFVAVVEGLKLGDEVVTTGVFKLRNGESVVVNNKLAPPFALAPKPDNS